MDNSHLNGKEKSKAIITVGFDIDTEWQCVVIEYWLRKYGYTETSMEKFK